MCCSEPGARGTATGDKTQQAIPTLRSSNPSVCVHPAPSSHGCGEEPAVNIASAGLSSNGRVQPAVRSHGVHHRRAGDKPASPSQQSTEDLGQELTRTSYRRTFLVRGLRHRVPLPLLPRQSVNSAICVMSSGSRAYGAARCSDMTGLAKAESNAGGWDALTRERVRVASG